MEKEEIKELVKEEVAKQKRLEDREEISKLVKEYTIREISDIRSRLGFKGLFDREKLKAQIKGIIDFELGEFKEQIMETALKRDQRTYEIIEETVKGMIGEKVSEPFIKSVIVDKLTNKLHPFVEEVVRASYHKFSGQISRKLRDMINLKTSTISEIKEVVEKIPVEFGDDEEFFKAVVHKDWKLLEDKKE